MADLASIRLWQPSGLSAASDDLDVCTRRIVAVGDTLDRARTPAGWTGLAADSAALQNGQLVSGIREAAADAASVHRATGEAADGISNLHRLIADADQLASENGLTIGPTGRVTEAVPLIGLGEEELVSARAERDRAIEDLTVRIEQIVRTGTDIDSKLAAVMRNIDVASPAASSPVTTAAAAAMGTALGAITAPVAPSNGTPVQNAAWWQTLTQAEQAAVVRDHPAVVGSMDGLPASARSQANVSRLDRERVVLDRELTRVEGTDPRTERGRLDRQRQITELQGKLDSLTTIGAVMSQGGRQLLHLDTSGRRVKTAVAVGDVDTADNVAVFTPGFTSTVDGSLENYDTDMNNLQIQSTALSRQFGNGETTAAITWLGYEAPQWDELADPSHSVAGSAAAETGGQDLNRFYHGIGAARTDDPHLVALGHSYGSTATGYAVREPSPVDATVLFGSPGAGGATDVSDLRGGPLYVLEAKNDPVADLGRFGTDPNQMPGVTQLSTEETYSPVGSMRASEGHSEYLAERSTSQYNIAVVVAGHPDRAITTDAETLGVPGGFGDFLRQIGPGS